MTQYEHIQAMPLEEMVQEFTECSIQCNGCAIWNMDLEEKTEACTICTRNWLNAIDGDSKPQTQQKSKNKYRPCIVRGRKALFHMWENFSKPVAAELHIGGAPAGVLSLTLAIVEFEDGTVDRVLPQEVKFADNKFKEYVFGGKE